MTDSTLGIHRTIPVQPWPVLAVIVAIVLAVLATGWEVRCRAAGYQPSLDDTRDLWVENRRRVTPDGVVIVGSSRGLFGLDLDEIEQGLGQRPVQLCLVGSCVYPILKSLADDTSFHGTVLCDLVPGLLMVPSMAPPYHNSEAALERARTQTKAQRWSHFISLPLEYSFASLQQEDLTLSALLHGLPIPNRQRAQIGPPLPPDFYSIDADRRARMEERVLTDAALRDHIKHGWVPLFTPPPKPHWIPDAAFGDFMQKLVEGRFAAMAAAVSAIRDRGGRVVFLRMPSSGDLRVVEDKLTPRAAIWERLLRESGAPGIDAEDHQELNNFDLPEWSHLSAKDSVEFTHRLVPHLREVLGKKAAP